MVTFYDYDEQGRVSRSWTQSEWTAEDRVLMLARQEYLRTLCPRCGHPKDRAWHPDNDGWFEVTDSMTCHACTALANHDHEGPGVAPPVQFHVLSDTRDYDAKPLPPIWP